MASFFILGRHLFTAAEGRIAPVIASDRRYRVRTDNDDGIIDVVWSAEGTGERSN
ncbi:hypothetical protein BC629DRAFT_1476191 [Irpex lacteus]|nr:hypothetical protein BC629DRAFT_1476191 [Irpex lacteus]